MTRRDIFKKALAGIVAPAAVQDIHAVNPEYVIAEHEVEYFIPLYHGSFAYPIDAIKPWYNANRPRYTMENGEWKEVKP